MRESNGPTEQAAYERELKRQDGDLALKKQELTQKEHNDKMMLTVTTISVIVALIAVGVTLWASLDTSENSKRALDLQNQSINAQIQAMRNDERPYVTVEVEGSEPLRFSDRQAQGSSADAVSFKVLVPRLHALAFGRTPAVGVENHEDCTLFNDDGGREFPDPSQHWIAMDTIFQGQKPHVSCLPEGRMPVGTTLGSRNLVRLEGFIKYKSLAGDVYSTPYCYEYYVHPGKAPKTCTVKPPS